MILASMFISVFVTMSFSDKYVKNPDMIGGRVVYALGSIKRFSDGHDSTEDVCRRGVQMSSFLITIGAGLMVGYVMDRKK